MQTLNVDFSYDQGDGKKKHELCIPLITFKN